MITVKIADIPIGIDNRFEYIAQLSAEYITDESPVFVVDASDADIDKERDVAGESFSNAYLESIVVFRKIAERLPEYDAVVFHGAALATGGKAYAFTAKSGVGKTTHTSLWISEFGARVHYINGDKPVIRIVDGTPYLYGTPWRGKEGYGKNESAPLAAIALLERAETNSANVIEPNDGVVRLIRQIHIPKNQKCAALAMRVADVIISSVRFIELKCNMERDAAVISAEAMMAD